jgi:hypothetical protein
MILEWPRLTWLPECAYSDGELPALLGPSSIEVKTKPIIDAISGEHVTPCCG